RVLDLVATEVHDPVEHPRRYPPVLLLPRRAAVPEVVPDARRVRDLETHIALDDLDRRPLPLHPVLLRVRAIRIAHQSPAVADARQLQLVAVVVRRHSTPVAPPHHR